MAIKKIQELVSTAHAIQRINERAINIADIVYPSAVFEGIINKEELKNSLDDKIKKIIRARILAYQTLQDLDPSKYVTTVIVTVQLKKNSNLYYPIIKTISDGKEHEGNTYVGFTNRNTLLTLEIIPKENVNPHFLTQSTINHWKTKGITISENDVEVKMASNCNATLDIESILNLLKAPQEQLIGVPKSPEDLPYKAKKDYVKSSKGRPNFVTHKDFGRGEILSSEQGMGGKWNNVSIKFPSGIKMFKTLYSLNFFGK